MVRAYSETASEKGTVPFCSEDERKIGTVPGGFPRRQFCCGGQSLARVRLAERDPTSHASLDSLRLDWPFDSSSSFPICPVGKTGAVGRVWQPERAQSGATARGKGLRDNIFRAVAQGLTNS